MNDSTHRLARLIIVCATAGMILTTMTSCNNIKLNSRWTNGAMQIDGRAGDWKGVTSHFIEESEASVAFANDSSRLYILMRTRDPRLAAVIRRSGLKLWVNGEGKGEESFVIRYRGGPTREEMRAMPGVDKRHQKDREPQFMAPDTGGPVLTCFVKDRIVEMEIPVDGSTGPAASCSVDGGFFTYEFSLPLHESALRSYGLAAVPGQTIRIGAKWGGKQGMSQGRSGKGGMQMMPPGGGGDDFGGGGGRSGGGHGGGRGGDRSQKRPKPAAAQDIQMSLRLAESSGT